MYFIVLIAVFVLVILSSYVLLNNYFGNASNREKSDYSTLESKLDSLFVKDPARTAKNLKLFTPIALFCIGFLLPSTVSTFDKIVLDNIVKMNKRGQHDQALTLMAGLKRGVSPLLHNELGIAHVNLGGLDRAIKHFEFSVRLEPDYSVAHANLAAAYLSKGRDIDAEFEYKRAKDALAVKLSEERVYGESSATSNTLVLRLLFGVIFLFVGIKLPIWLVTFLYNRRIKKFEMMLPDALSVLSNSLKAGLSLTQGIESLIEQSRPPISQEFELVMREYKLGKSIDAALNGLYERLPTEDNEILVNTTSLLFETGGDIPSAIENVVHTIKERKRIRQKISAMTAEGKAQAIMLLLIPLTMAFLLNSSQKETFSLLYTTVIGWGIILFCIVWGLLGVWTMWKTVQVKI